MAGLPTRMCRRPRLTLPRASPPPRPVLAPRGEGGEEDSSDALGRGRAADGPRSPRVREGDPRRAASNPQRKAPTECLLAKSVRHQLTRARLGLLLFLPNGFSFSSDAGQQSGAGSPPFICWNSCWKGQGMVCMTLSLASDNGDR